MSTSQRFRRMTARGRDSVGAGELASAMALRAAVFSALRGRCVSDAAAEAALAEVMVLIGVRPAVAPAKRVVRPEVCPSCGSGSAFEVWPPCSLDAFDPDAWHSPSSWRHAGPVVVVEHHMDIEAHARSFNEGFETAVAQGLADDPALAAEWLAQHDREIAARALLEAATVAVTTGIPRTFLGDPDVDSFEVEASRRGLVAAWLCERANCTARGELAPPAQGGERS